MSLPKEVDEDQLGFGVVGLTSPPPRASARASVVALFFSLTLTHTHCLSHTLSLAIALSLAVSLTLALAHLPPAARLSEGVGGCDRLCQRPPHSYGQG